MRFGPSEDTWVKCAECGYDERQDKKHPLEDGDRCITLGCNGIVSVTVTYYTAEDNIQRYLDDKENNFR